MAKEIYPGTTRRFARPRPGWAALPEDMRRPVMRTLVLPARETETTWTVLGHPTERPGLPYAEYGKGMDEASARAYLKYLREDSPFSGAGMEFMAVRVERFLEDW